MNTIITEHKSTSTKRRELIQIALICAIALSLSNIAFALPAQPQIQSVENYGPQGVEQVLPSLIRQITHDKGNISTTIDNWGLIGGYNYISEDDFPSGEWPRNSQHSYIAEIKYWMGAINLAGDTLLANTYDDFQPMSSFRTDSKALNILLSTDSLSYAFDVTDTLGTGLGSPALGWRVWNSDSAAWVYNQLYSSSDSAFFPGGPIAVQESHYRFNDGARGTPALGLELTQTIYQWNFCYNEDFFFVVLDIKNVSTEDYSNFAFGLYVDLDVGGFHAQTGENGRLNDMVGYDTANGLAWIYDVTGYDAGWGAETGYMGTKYLQTPDNIGMTAMRNELWDNLPQDLDEDGDRYAMIAAPNTFDTPLPPNDQIYIQATSGINLQAGKTVQVIYAIVAGADEAAFRDNADRAQTLFDSYFVGPVPPPTPTLTVRNADRRVYLNWDNLAEEFIDPLSGVRDFSGYKLYRSSDFGQTWGKATPLLSNSCQASDFETIANFRVSAPGDPIPHTYVDTGLINGVEYWYSLAAFDLGDSAVPIDPLQNSFGTPGADRNVVRGLPSTNPAGYVSARSSVSRSPIPDSSFGTIWPIVLDPDLAGNTIYKVGFYEDDVTTYWALTDSLTGDTLLTDQTLQFINGEVVPDSVIGFFEIARGMRVAVFNGERMLASGVQTTLAGADTSLILRTDYGPTTALFGWPVGSDRHFRADYEIRFTVTGSDGADLADDITPVTMPFEVWNVTTNQRVYAEIYDFNANGAWEADEGDLIGIVNVPYDGNIHPEAWPTNHVWLFNFEPAQAVNAVPGDVFLIRGAPVNRPADEFYFSPDGIDLALASGELRNIKVAPNPYIARASLWENNNEPTKLNFIHLPGKCSVRIYTLAGDLVKTIAHNGPGGDASWNLISESGQQVASGIYFYHVESDAGEFLGRFAVIN